MTFNNAIGRISLARPVDLIVCSIRGEKRAKKPIADESRTDGSFKGHFGKGTLPPFANGGQEFFG
jgi:hypothetical protein